MTYDELFKNVKGYLREDDLTPLNIADLELNELGYLNIDDFVRVFSPFKLENIYTTKNPLSPFIYADYDNSIYTDLYNLSRLAITTYVVPEKRYKYTLELIEQKDYLQLYIAMLPNMLAIDFIKNYKRIPVCQIKDIFLFIYQSMDYNFDVFPRNVIEDVFRIIKSTSNNSDKFIKIYRGMETKSTPLEYAWSWTTKKSIALKFSTRWNTGLGKIYEGYIKEKDIVYMETDGEYEVLCFYEDIIGIKESATNAASKEFEQIFPRYNKEYTLYSCYIDADAFSKGVHDYHHSLRVMFWSLVLSEKLNLTNNEKMILIQSSLLHDIGRIHDFVDTEHGKRAVEIIKDNNLNPLELEKQDLFVVNSIISNHCIDDEDILESNKDTLKLIKIFKDCDALDRVRIFDLDPSYLRFEESKELAIYAKELLDYI